MARTLFEVPYDPSWGYEPRFFADVEHRFAKMHRLLREERIDLDGAHIVDLGLSRGLLLERFRGYAGVELTGTEIDEAEIEHARRRGLEPVIHHINVFEGSRLTAVLPFDDASADVVLAGEIIEHIVDTEAFLREIRRVLRPGGAVVLSTPNLLWWKARLEVLAGRYPAAVDYRTRYGDDAGHVRAFTPRILRQLLAETGFDHVRVLGKRLGSIAALTRTPQLLASALDRAADRLPALADDAIAFARRPVSS